MRYAIPILIAASLMAFGPAQAESVLLTPGCTYQEDSRTGAVMFMRVCSREDMARIEADAKRHRAVNAGDIEDLKVKIEQIDKYMERLDSIIQHLDTFIKPVQPSTPIIQGGGGSK